LEDHVTQAKRILIVDDDPRVLLVLRVALERMAAGYRIVVARDGLKALERLKKTYFDLVITDVRMPRMDGIELAQEIRALSLDTVVIWITAYGSQNLQARREELGVQRCLDKPLRIVEIRQATQEVLG
jgi:CheY-like chemotaxis protein